MPLHKPVNPDVQSIADITKAEIDAAYKHLDGVLKSTNRRLWKTGKFTPQQIADALGPDANAVFQFVTLSSEYLGRLSALTGHPAPEPALPPGASVAQNPDGTVKVTAPEAKRPATASQQQSAPVPQADLPAGSATSK